MYNIVTGAVAVKPDEYLTAAYNRTRSNNNKKFQHMQARTDICKNSYFPKTIPEWNNLSNETVNSISIETFKAHLKNDILIFD